VTPVVGVTTYLEPASWGTWHRPAALIPQSYVDGVLAGGGVPVLLPVQPTSNAAAALRALDGLVLTGGADVDPAHYAAPPGPHTESRPERDAWELALLRSALDRGMPVLAICRGMQLLNVALGGTLHQHLPELLDEPGPVEADGGGAGAAHRPAPGVFGANPVRTAPGSLAARLLGDSATASCHHHQAIHELGTGLVATAWAADGTVEAVEHPGHQFVFGVQWHPEEDATDARLFAALVHACTESAPNAPAASDSAGPA
jgi:gamma-glutamyl-gamma-aminobutyrate hydrolase PuuD